MIGQNQDSMQGEPVLGLVGTALADVRLDRDAAEVVGRGRTLRRRRRAAPVLATAGVLAAALSLAAVAQPRHTPSAGHDLAYSGKTVNVDQAGFSIHTDVKSGVVTLTLRQVFDQAEVARLLNEAGIPTVFHSGEPCSWTGAAVLSPQLIVPDGLDGGDSNVFKIDRNTMPRGSVIAIDFVELYSPHGVGVDFKLLAGQPTGCTPYSHS
jgi:hypothetical protein